MLMYALKWSEHLMPMYALKWREQRAYSWQAFNADVCSEIKEQRAWALVGCGSVDPSTPAALCYFIGNICIYFTIVQQHSQDLCWATPFMARLASWAMCYMLSCAHVLAWRHVRHVLYAAMCSCARLASREPCVVCCHVLAWRHVAMCCMLPCARLASCEPCVVCCHVLMCCDHTSLQPCQCWCLLIF